MTERKGRPKERVIQRERDGASVGPTTSVCVGSRTHC